MSRAARALRRVDEPGVGDGRPGSRYGRAVTSRSRSMRRGPHRSPDGCDQPRFGRLQRCKQSRPEAGQEPRRRLTKSAVPRSEWLCAVSPRSEHHACIRHLRERLVCAHDLQRSHRIAAQSDVCRYPALRAHGLPAHARAVCGAATAPVPGRRRSAGCADLGDPLISGSPLCASTTRQAPDRSRPPRTQTEKIVCRAERG